MLYNNLSTYLKSRYEKNIRKICIDGGFTCPNRDGKCSWGGCIFCGERGAGEHIDPTASIKDQVRTALEQGRADGYIAYFQNFTNTYAPCDLLKERYDAALGDERIVALAIGTRPDCIDEDVARLIASYKDRVDVWVELGLQTASDKTAATINRGYKTEVFVNAVRLLADYGIPVVAHMIIGLPGEGEAEAYATVELFNSLPLWGVKIHSLYVMKGTALADLYRKGEYTPITKEKYVSICAECIARLRPDIIIHRITGDCPEGLLVAPEWNRGKSAVIEDIRKRLANRGLGQGSLCLESIK